MLKKIWWDIDRVVSFVDDENTNILTFPGLGYIFFFLGVFKVAYNENFQIDSSKIEEGSFKAVKNYEWKEAEENFLKNVWAIINPKHNEVIDWGSLIEFLKLLFDPYSSLMSLVPLFEQLLVIMHLVSEKIAEQFPKQNQDDS